jgi:formiminoglutamase
MLGSNYKAANKKDWQGRIDSHTNYDAFRWHQCIEPIDLDDVKLEPFRGKLGFAIIGFCCDKGVERNKGRIGASKGPQSIRKELANRPCLFKKEVKLYDAGNIIPNDLTLEENQQLLSKAVHKIIKLNLFPIVLGGGHETALGNYNGILSHLTNHKEKPKIGIINFDAHFDLRPYNPNEGGSGTMFRQIADDCQQKGIDYSYFCIGIQKYSNTVDLFKTADKLGVEYILEKDIVDGDNWQVIEKLERFIKKQDHIYITICADVFSSSFAPGVSATQPLGLDPERVLKYLKYILRSGKTISFDIAEVSPRFDHDNITSNLASIIIFAVVNAITQNHNLEVEYNY